MSDVQESVTTEIAKQEAADNILNEDVAVEPEAVEDFNAEVEDMEVVEEEIVVPQVEETSGSDWDIDEEAEAPDNHQEDESDSEWD